MKKLDLYRKQLQNMPEWDEFLLAESGLPGPRGNIELARAVAVEGDATLFSRYRKYTPEQAPVNSPEEFLVFCGVLGLGPLLCQGESAMTSVLRHFAADPRWRTREAVAMALQEWGKSDMTALLAEMKRWAHGNELEQRAAAAALCEPVLLKNPAQTSAVITILNTITRSIPDRKNRRSDAFKALRKGLGYCWSVAVAAQPEKGIRVMEQWLDSTDRDIIWIMKENLKKKRLERVAAEWVSEARKRLNQSRER